jgi:hypothetical protein
VPCALRARRRRDDGGREHMNLGDFRPRHRIERFILDAEIRHALHDRMVVSTIV